MSALDLQPSLFDQIIADEYAQKTEEQQALVHLGKDAQQLKAMELLSILTGMSREQAGEVLKRAGGVLELARLPEQAIATFPHVGPKRAEKIKAMTAWAELVSQPATDSPVQIRSPADIANLFLLEMSLLEREQLRVIGLDTKNNVGFVDTVYSGSLNTTVVRIAEVLRMAVIMNCASIILVHNHPSGDPTPSPEDVKVTEMIKEAAGKFDITVLDHLVIGKNRYMSLKEKGLGFS